MRNFRLFFTSCAIAITPLLYGNAFAHNLPDLGNDFRSTISVSDERLIGDLMLRELRAAGLVHPDPVINEYVRHIGSQLTPYMAMPYQDLKIKFFAINDKSINAFAFFGGHVAVHSGLIQVADTESELAGVMAHELAHVSQQHVLRSIAESKRMMPVTLAGSIAAIALGIPELVLPALAGHSQQMLNFSRQHEQEADRLGLQILAQANFDPQGLPNMLERLGSELRYDNRPPEYLLSHPLFDTRVSDTRIRANSLNFKRQASSNMFHLIKARIAVQHSTNLQQYIEDAEHVLATQRYTNKLAAHYGYSYALLQKGQVDKAWDAIRELAETYPDEMIIQLTAAEIELQQHKVLRAKIRLQQLMDYYPDSSAVLLHYTDLLLQTKQPKQAKKILAKYKALYTPDPHYYEMVRQSEGMLGNQIAVLEANAEWYLLHGDFGSALKQLSIAAKDTENDTKAHARIETRLKEIEELLARVKKV